VILRVLPLRDSTAPVGFIYDGSPDPVNGGLLAAASAFFSHQGHQVFHDQCPDLVAYFRSMGVPPSTIVIIDRLPDYLLNSGLEILSDLAAISPTAAAVAGTAFMASYLSPSSLGIGSSRRDDGGVQVSSSQREDDVHEGPFILDHGDSGIPVDPQGSSPPRRPRLHASAFIGGSVPGFRTPVRNPYVGPSRSTHTDPGGFSWDYSIRTDPGRFSWEYRPPPVGAPAARRPDPDEDVIVPASSGRGSASSGRGSLSSSVSWAKSSWNEMRFVLGECVVGGTKGKWNIFMRKVLLWPPIPRTKQVPKFWHPSITPISVHLHDVGELKASILTESSPLSSKTDFFQMDKKRVSAKNYKISPKQSIQKIRRGGAGVHRRKSLSR
jgi:hypothetical protein